jgi:hypothetical protein
MKLIALLCPSCQQPLAPAMDHVVTGCLHCHQAVYLDEAGPRQQKVYYAVPANDQDRAYHPLWVFSGQVHLDRRETQSGGKGSQRDAEELWGAPRRLYVPAWELSLPTAQAAGSQLIQSQPDFEFGPRPEGATLLPAVIDTADALKLLEFIVLAIEARRKDWLKQLDFRIVAAEPQLWALPASVFR